MIAPDTNLLVRYLARDYDAQFQVAFEFIDDFTIDAQGYACREVIIELVWVFES